MRKAHPTALLAQGHQGRVARHGHRAAPAHQVYRLNGTSIAAVVVARRLYNAMMKESIRRIPKEPKKDCCRRVVEVMADDEDEVFIRRSAFDCGRGP